MRSNLGLKTALLFVILWLAGCYDYHDPRNEAKAYAADLGMKTSGITCSNADSDYDGYVSCTLSEDGKLIAIECNYRWGGCRMQKPSVQVRQ